jgi:amphi-Trp domain-containing protein
LRDDRSPGSARTSIPTEGLAFDRAKSSASRAHGDPINNFRHKGEERLSRQQAAERLIDLAYALVTGGPLRLESDLQVTVADEVVLKRDGNSKDDRVLLEIELSWSTISAVAPAPPGIDQS